MSLSEARFQEILSEYEAVRFRNERRAAERKNELYEKYPLLRELDDKIADVSVSAAERYIGGDDEALSAMREEIRALTARKQRVMEKAGIREEDLLPVYDCPDCRDTGFAGGRKCHCLRQRIINALYEQSNLAGVLQKENFSTFSLSLFPEEVRENAAKIRDDALRFSREIKTEYRNLLFLGNVGSGKTFFSNCIAKEVLDQGCSVIYFSAFRLFRLLADHAFRREEAEEGISGYSREILDCDLLILDDLGTEMTTSFDRSELFLILNERDLRRRPTVISSNLSLEKLKYNYSERSFSRLLSGYDLYYFEWEDLRLRKRTLFTDYRRNIGEEQR